MSVGRIHKGVYLNLILFQPFSFYYSPPWMVRRLSTFYVIWLPLFLASYLFLGKGMHLPWFHLYSWVALVVKNPPANTGDLRDSGSISGLGRSLRGGHANPLQYSSLENPTDRGAWRATVHRVAKS